jgi:O-succinylbenzoic acid--CoA ligase
MDFNFSGIILNDKLFSTEDLVPHCENMLKRSKLPKWEENIYHFLLEFLDEKEYIIQLSSGTTGTPKEFKLPKKAMIESARNTIDKLGLKWTDKALLCLPIEYIAGKMMVVRAFVAGLNLFWEEPTSMPSLAKYGTIDFCAMVPLQVYNSFSNYDFFKNIRNLIIGGSELRSEVIAMFSDVDNNTYETYGMAETCSHIALRKISGDEPDKYFETLEGITVSVDDRNCLVVHTPYLESSVVTNDVVEFIDETHFVWKGRIDNLINTGGIKIKPEELEANISKVIEMECAVIGLPDDTLGQKVMLILETDQAVNNEEILEALKENLQAHLVPKEIFVVEELPRTSSFKIDRSKLEALIS